MGKATIFLFSSWRRAMLGARRGLVACLIVVSALLAPASLEAQETRYVYDALGRLIAVIDAQGRVTIYDYDAVGNITAIRRPVSSDPLAITFVNPVSGVAGSVVEIIGVGFGATPPDNQVSFNGVPAVVSSASPTRLVATVPAGATTGPIRVTTASGSADSPTPFTILGIAVAPAEATVILGRSRQFIATLAGVPDPGIAWSVDGVPGGSPIVGTITPAGLYTAPFELPLPSVVQVQARSVRYPQLAAAAIVALAPPSTSVIATPVDIRIVRIGTGDPGGLSTNVTVATPSTVVVARPGLGDTNGLANNVTVAAPPLISVARPGIGEMGLPMNLTVAPPPTIAIVRPGDSETAAGVTVARPTTVTVARPGTGEAGQAQGVTVAKPPDVTVRRP
jgi:YD repeat-containing protein